MCTSQIAFHNKKLFPFIALVQEPVQEQVQVLPLSGAQHNAFYTLAHDTFCRCNNSGHDNSVHEVCDACGTYDVYGTRVRGAGHLHYNCLQKEIPSPGTMT